MHQLPVNAKLAYSFHAPCSYLVFNKVNAIISLGMKALLKLTCFSSHGNNLSLLIYVDEQIFFCFQTFTVDIHFLHISRFIHKFSFVDSTYSVVFGNVFFNAPSFVHINVVAKKMCHVLLRLLPVGIFSWKRQKIYSIYMADSCKKPPTQWFWMLFFALPFNSKMVLYISIPSYCRHFSLVSVFLNFRIFPASYSFGWRHFDRLVWIIYEIQIIVCIRLS